MADVKSEPDIRIPARVITWALLPMALAGAATLETWVALRGAYWAGFALPVTLHQAVILNLAWSLVNRHLSAGEPSMKQLAEYVFVSPALFLVTMWAVYEAWR